MLTLNWQALARSAEMTLLALGIMGTYHMPLTMVSEVWKQKCLMGTEL